MKQSHLQASRRPSTQEIFLYLCPDIRSRVYKIQFLGYVTHYINPNYTVLAYFLWSILILSSRLRINVIMRDASLDSYQQFRFHSLYMTLSVLKGPWFGPVHQGRYSHYLDWGSLLDFAKTRLSVPYIA
jgi:hypothetical protein